MQVPQNYLQNDQDEELVHLIALLQNIKTNESYLNIVERIGLAGSAVQAWQGPDFEALFSLQRDHNQLAQAHDSLTKWRLQGYGVHHFYSDTFPAQLREIHEMPLIVWTYGSLAPDKRAVSVVGTRKPSSWALKFVDDVVAGLVEREITIVSGLALGIDTRAHEKSLEIGGRTVAVLGNGLDHAYPPANAMLQEQIASHGLLLSQFSPEMHPTRKTFPMRNAVMSGFSRVSLIVEASEHSGTRIQGRVAVAHGRAVILTHDVVSSTQWGSELQSQPGVHVVNSASEAVELAELLSDPLPKSIRPLTELLRA